MSTSTLVKTQLSYLEILEAEAIHVLRESAAEFEKPVILFSGGKDSITLVHLAKKAFYPAPIPFSLLHIDTGHNFPETLAFRDRLVQNEKLSLLVGSVETTIRQGKAQEETGPIPSRNAIQSVTLLESIKEHKIDACIGGGRRDEEKARAKERFFSVRNTFGGWNPKLQRPELWNLYNTKLHQGENMRIFPMSNWTEIDVWEYIRQENIAIPELYFAHQREVVYLEGSYFPLSSWLPIKPESPEMKIEKKSVRFRTLGDMTCTAAFPSKAQTLSEIILELKTTKTSERGSRLDDKRSSSAMEDRKKQGYF